MLLMAGDQLPLTLLVDVAGSGFTVAPAQTGPTAAKAGDTVGLTAIAIVTVVAHCPAPGVNV